MRRGLILLVVGVLLVTVTVLFVANRRANRDAGQRGATGRAAPMVNNASRSSEGPRVVIRVEGVEVEADLRPRYETRLSDMPVEDLDSSQISSVRSRGSSQVLVLVDGSEVSVNPSNRERLPADVQYRLTYDRSGDR